MLCLILWNLVEKRKHVAARASFSAAIIFFSFLQFGFTRQSQSCTGEDACLVFSTRRLAGLWGSVGLGLKALLQCHSLLLNMPQALAAPPPPHLLSFTPSLPSVWQPVSGGIRFGCDRSLWGLGHQMCGQISVCFVLVHADCKGKFCY